MATPRPHFAATRPAGGRARRSPTAAGATAVLAASVLAAASLAAAAAAAVPVAPAAAAAQREGGRGVTTAGMADSSPQPFGADSTTRGAEAGPSAPRWRLPVDGAHVIWITFLTILPWTVVGVFDAIDHHFRYRSVLAARLGHRTVCIAVAYVMGGWYVGELESLRERWDQVATVLATMFFNWYVGQSASLLSIFLFFGAFQEAAGVAWIWWGVRA